MRAANAKNRGLVLAWTKGGNLEAVMLGGMKGPPHFSGTGLKVWQGRVYIGEDMPPDAEPRDGVWFEGLWRVPTESEWAAIQRGTTPF